MTQQIYTQYYKQHGVRRLQSLLSPRMLPLINLPRDALVHYLTNTGINDVDVTLPYLKGYGKRIMIDFIDMLDSNKGNPRRRLLLVKTLVRDWLMQHRDYKQGFESYKIIVDPLTLLIVNYNYLDELYKYTDLPMTVYNKWWNQQDTLWHHVNTIADQSNRNQFVFLTVPKELPGYSFLKLFSTRTTSAMLKVFDDYDKLSLLELWKWLDPETRDMSLLARVEPKNYSKVNLVFTNSDNLSLVVNLGYLNSWVEGQENTTEFDTVIQLKPIQLQKVFLKTMMLATSLVNTDTLAPDTEVSTNQDESDIQEQQDLKDEEAELQETDTFANTTDKPISYITAKGKGKLDEFKEQEARAESEVNLQSNLTDIDEDLKVLDSMQNQQLLNKGVKIDHQGEMSELQQEEVELSREEIINKALKPVSNEEALKTVASEQADMGALTASEYKNILRDIENYSKMKDPYGSKQTVVEASVITESDLQLSDEKSRIAPIKTVMDQGMLQSSLLSYDSDYINNVLHKDVLSMIGGVQKAGVIIKRHEVELDHSALGSYENHTIELKPIRGMSSTLRFRLPVIQEDGTLVANNSKYIMRKQRVDLPIRKISPNEVALTSYYGKTFITRGAKKANSSLEWILKQINLSIFDDAAFISKVAPANVFNNNIKTPYIYSSLSNYYKSFMAGDVFLSFDFSKRFEILGIDSAAGMRIEDSKYVCVGLTKKRQLVLVDYKDQFYTYDGKDYVLLGDIYRMLQLQQKMAPLDFTEVRVFNKAIPVGVFLGYFLGFGGLVKLLDVPHQVVDTKPRVLKDDEYAITFKDRSYIFSRNDGVASMILAGYTQYSKLIKTYSYKDFNHKDVYFNLLRDKGLTSIYVREMELTNQLFIDPITLGILQDMQEPTTFIGLLIRATELLKFYDHPDSQDLTAMRIRGYERLSGMVYKEMVASIRQFNNRTVVGKSKLEMSPYKVWQTVMKDNSMKLVEDINPIQNLKESEVVTYVGEGGRQKDSMSKPTRAYHKEDMGVISEATVDSSDVGINAYLSANPNFKNLRGLVKKNKQMNITSMMSTSANLMVGGVHDD